MRSFILAATLVVAPAFLHAQDATERRATGPLRGAPDDKLSRAPARSGTPAPKPTPGTVVVAPPPSPVTAGAGKASVGAPAAGTTPPSGRFDPNAPPARVVVSPPLFPTRDALVRAAYAAAAKTNPRVQPADMGGWQTIARMTGLDYESLVAAYDAIYVVDCAQKYLLRHSVMPADSARVVALVQRLRAGERWQSVWRDVAQSPEVERVAGAWAPAPMDSPEQARERFGLRQKAAPEQCVGAVGDMCDGGVPPIFPSVQPRWSNYFTMPDGTRMGFVEVGVNVGSILFHDSCAGTPLEAGCTSFQVLGSQTAHSSLGDKLMNSMTFGGSAAGILGGGIMGAPGTIVAPPADEQTLAARAGAWNKAVWNVADRRGWRETFGPYPVEAGVRRTGWYDDLRPAAARAAWMAPAYHVAVPGPDQTLAYSGSETHATARLAAPGGAQLDGRDGAFCRSHAFKSVTTPLLKAPLGVCQ